MTVFWKLFIYLKSNGITFIIKNLHCCYWRLRLVKSLFHNCSNPENYLYMFWILFIEIHLIHCLNILRSFYIFTYDEANNLKIWTIVLIKSNMWCRTFSRIWTCQIFSWMFYAAWRRLLVSVINILGYLLTTAKGFVELWPNLKKKKIEKNNPVVSLVFAQMTC